MHSARTFGAKKMDCTIMDINDAPSDTVSDIAFNLEGTRMAVSSWDHSVKVYALPQKLGTFGSAPSFIIEKSFILPKPVLSVCFLNQNVVAGLVDGTLTVIDMVGNQNSLPAHSASIKCVKNFANKCIITGSFDKTLKFWNLETAALMHSVNLPGKVYSMDLKGSFLVVALSDKSVQHYDLNNMEIQGNVATRFTYSIRSVGCSYDLDTIAAGGVEAKVEVLSRTSPVKRVVFRCHRTPTRLYSVNLIRFYPHDSNLIVTGGSDGTLVWFDKNMRSKFSTNEFSAPITAGEFTNDGAYFVFGVGDDWSKGYSGTSVPTSLKFIVVNTIPGLSNK